MTAASAGRFVLHHNPRSRSQRARWMLEEIGAPYETVFVDLESGAHKTPDFLALNPDGKLPTLVDRGPDGTAHVVVTESSAIVLHLADCHPEAGLAPPPGSPERGRYLTWIVYAAAALEPAFADSAFPRADATPRGMLGWPSFDKALERVVGGVDPGPWLLGGNFSAADVVVGSLLGWLNSWGKLPEPERFAAYLGRIAERPAHQKTFAR